MQNTQYKASILSLPDWELLMLLHQRKLKYSTQHQVVNLAPSRML